MGNSLPLCLQQNVQQVYKIPVLHIYQHKSCQHTEIKLAHWSGEKWWPRKVAVTSCMYKGCSITSLLNSRLQLMKGSDPYCWLCTNYFAPSTCTSDHLSLLSYKKQRGYCPGLTTGTMAYYPWLSLCRVVVVKFTSSGLHTIWGVIPTRHSSCTLCCYRDRLDSSAWSLTIHFLLQ